MCGWSGSPVGRFPSAACISRDVPAGFKDCGKGLHPEADRSKPRVFLLSPEDVYAASLPRRSAKRWLPFVHHGVRGSYHAVRCTRILDAVEPDFRVHTGASSEIIGTPERVFGFRLLVSISGLLMWPRGILCSRYPNIKITPSPWPFLVSQPDGNRTSFGYRWYQDPFA